MSVKTRTASEIQREISELLATEVHVETNEGTYSASEAHRCVGTGDPAFANRQVYESVAGSKRTTGPSDESAPGRMRQINRGLLAEYRQRLAALRRELHSA